MFLEFLIVFVMFMQCFCTVSVVFVLCASVEACILFAQGVSSTRIEPGTEKGLRDRNSPTCTLSQNGYGDSSVVSLQHVLGHGDDMGCGDACDIDQMSHVRAAGKHFSNQ